MFGSGAEAEDQAHLLLQLNSAAAGNEVVQENRDANLCVAFSVSRPTAAWVSRGP